MVSSAAFGMKLSNKVQGGSFNFLDYFASVERQDTHLLEVSVKTTLSDVQAIFYNYKIHFDFDRLSLVYPFRK